MITQLPARETWSWYLQQVDPTDVHNEAQQLRERYQLSVIERPQSGQHSLVVTDSIEQAPFQLGDIPFAKAQVQLIDNNSSHHGAAIIAQNDAQLAEDIATLDAALAGHLDGSSGALDLLLQGQRIHQQLIDDQSRLLQATHVDFELLGTERSTEDEL